MLDKLEFEASYIIKNFTKIILMTLWKGFPLSKVVVMKNHHPRRLLYSQFVPVVTALQHRFCHFQEINASYMYNNTHTIQHYNYTHTLF